jgi:hypothetical protein
MNPGKGKSKGMSPMFIRRREFLNRLGAGAALAPFVPYLNREAEAAVGGTYPRRVLLVFSGNGTVENEFWPQGGENDFTFKPGSITEPLAPHRSKLIFPRGMRRLASGSGAHEKNMGGLWTCCGLVATNGYPRGPSVDQIIANAIAPPTAFKSIQFGVQCDSFNPGGNKAVLKSMTYSGSNAVLRPEDDPAALFTKLMLPRGGGTAPPPPTTGPAMPDPALERVRARRQSMIDAVRADLRGLVGRIDRDDRQKLEQHIEGLAGIEKRLQQPINPNQPTGPVPSGAGCRAPDMAPGMFSDPAARALNENFPAIMDIQNRMAVAALACDRTRIATIQWSRSFSPIRHGWVGVKEDHHTISHRTGASDIKMLHDINRWYAQRFAELLGHLSAVKEGDGTLLDNTVVIWGNEANTGNHDPSPAVTVLAGSCGGKLNHGSNGRYLQLQSYDWSQLLITVAHAMGATAVNKVGDLPMKEGDIPTLLNA